MSSLLVLPRSAAPQGPTSGVKERISEKVQGPETTASGFQRRSCQIRGWAALSSISPDTLASQHPHPAQSPHLGHVRLQKKIQAKVNTNEDLGIDSMD